MIDRRIKVFPALLSTNNNRGARFHCILLVFSLLACCLFAPPSSALAQSKWIWSPRQDIDKVGYSDCYFRKKFTLVRPHKSELYVAAGDEYEIYVNGQLAGQGDSFGVSKKLDVTHLLVPGVNLIAARVTHFEGDKVGLALRLRVLEEGESRWRSLHSDETWKTRLQQHPEWHSTSLVDVVWLKAKAVSTADVVNARQTRPTASAYRQPVAGQHKLPEIRSAHDSQVKQIVRRINSTPVQASLGDGGATPAAQNSNSRYQLPPEFAIEKVVDENEAGSLIAMAFNEFGKLILSREGGPLLLADITRQPDDPNRIRVICDQVTSCQGILPLNGSIYVTGMGPDGLALYQLADNDRDGEFEDIQTVLRFKGELGEHGPHGLVLGADGMIYIAIGNACQIQADASSTSPYLHIYEGDLLPRYEDPGGHAVGVKAPGGTIVRISIDGKTIQRVAGGLRNVYDMVFDSHGELIVHDSDMESDIGMSWYRPTAVYHVHDGAELGWRSGWAKFPQYFVDQTPAVCETGRGSPAGAVLYQHLQYPAKYHDTVFLADWSEGRILALRQERQGAGFKATAEVFLAGKPLNVVDLDVGEDGALYFCTGGRGTSGGVYRVAWKGKVPDSMLQFKDDVARVIRHPQPSSSWARQNIAKLRQKIGERWAAAMQGIATEAGNPIRYRTRALDNMVLYGPFPQADLMNQLVADRSYQVRTKIANICGLKDAPEHIQILQRLVKDEHPRVRRAACESLMRLDKTLAFVELEHMLRSQDRIEAAVARRMLERIPAEQWSDAALASPDHRVFIQSSLSLMIAEPSLDRAYRVLARASEVMDGFVNDRDFMDLLRVIQITLARGNVDPQLIPAFVQRVKNEFPSNNGNINRELSRIIAYQQDANFDGRLQDYFDSAQDQEIDKTHVAMHLQVIGHNLSQAERLTLIAHLELARHHDGGGSYPFYLDRAINHLVTTATVSEYEPILKNAAQWPTAAIAVFQKLPLKLDEKTVGLVIDADQQAARSQDAKVRQMRLGVIAILARHGDQAAMDYLRKLWREEPDRRSDLSIGLAQQPTGENWAYLVSSLPVLDDRTSEEVLTKLATVNRRPRDAAHFRNVIVLGYRLRAEGGLLAAKLIEHWSSEPIADGVSNWKEAMSRCQAWFAEKWPEESPISIEQEATDGNYSMDQVLSHLELANTADPLHGQQVFAKAQCAKCHRYGQLGETNGPDLTSVASRFSRREIVESILHPSKVVSDQYQSKTILTVTGETLTGLAIEEAAGAYSIVNHEGNRIRLSASEIEDIKDSDVSGMPAKLLDQLSLKEIADLLAFLEQGTGNRAAQATQPQMHK